MLDARAMGKEKNYVRGVFLVSLNGGADVRQGRKSLLFSEEKRSKKDFNSWCGS
jgi:hypothetical protein